MIIKKSQNARKYVYKKKMKINLNDLFFIWAKTFVMCVRLGTADLLELT